MATSNLIFYYPYNKTMTGGPRVLLSLLELLDRKKFYPIVITQRQSPLVDELQKRNIEVLVIPLPDLLDQQDGKALKYNLVKLIKSCLQLFQYNYTIFRLLRSRNIKLIWARNIKAVLFVGLATRISGTKLIWDIGLGDDFQGIVKLLHFIGINLSNYVVTEGVCQHEKMFGRRLTRWYRNKLIHVLPGIDQERVRFIEALNKVSEKTSIQLISVATISPRKNQKMLVNMLGEVVPQFPHIHLNIVGGTPDEAYWQELQALVKEKKLESHITFLGWRNDIPELLKASDIMVLSSYNEGIPQAVVEAMHAGLPVIATRVGGVPDAVQDGETGYLITVDDVQSMSEKLLLLCQNPALKAEMGRNSKVFAKNNFTYQAYYQKYDKIFSKLLLQN